MVDLLNQAKNILSGKNPNTPPVISPDNRIDRVDQCKLLWYQWSNELSTDTKNAFGIGSLTSVSASSTDLGASRSYDISNHIDTWTYSKDMGGASGSFQFTLANSFDWPRFMRPGQWIVALLCGDGNLPMPEEVNGGVNTLSLPGIGLSGPPSPKAVSNLIGLTSGTSSVLPVPELPLPKGPSATYLASKKQYIRCIGIIQRVGIKSSTNADKTVEVTFSITGKDFGTIYEETELWFNANNADGAAFTAAINSISQQFVRNLGNLLDKWHDIFLNPGSVLSSSLSNNKAFFPQQWVVPTKLVNDLSLNMNSNSLGYFGEISDLKEFSATIFENPDPNPLSGLQGLCWDRLKSLSQPEFHELFTELSDNGNPRLYFRPIPWALDKSGYPTIGKNMLSYKDLTSNQSLSSPKETILNPGSTLASLPSFSLSADLDPLSNITAPTSDERLIHSVYVSSVEIESYDVGPDYHSRYNFFLVDSMSSMFDQTNAFALTSHLATPFPFRDESDIKRYGFKPKFINLTSFNITNSKLFSNTPAAQFMIEANALIKDFYGNAEDFYSGTMSVAAGRNDVKLGKVLVTDDTFQGIPEFVFYIEGYNDVFSVNGDGTASWTQSLTLTRGMQKNVLNGGSSKDKQATKAETFHIFNKDVKNSDDSTLGKIKNAIQNPKSLF